MFAYVESLRLTIPIRVLVLALATVAAERAVAQDARRPDATQKQAVAFPAASIERLKNLGYGAYERPPRKSDVPLVLSALAAPDLEISSSGCLAVEKLAYDRAFDAQTARAALDALVPKLRSSHQDTSDWAARGVRALAQYTPFVTRDVLSRIHAQTLKMLEDDDGEVRANGFGLARDLVSLLDQRQHEQLVRCMVSAYRRPIVYNAVSAKKGGKALADADLRARLMGILAFSAAADRIQDESLAGLVALQVLSAIGTEQTPEFFPGHLELCAIANLAAHVGPPMRQRIVLTLIGTVANDRYSYSPTFGEPSPPRHAGADALAIVAPLLDRELLERAEKAIPSPKLAFRPAEGYDSMYAPALKALADRRKQLDEHKRLCGSKH